MATEYRVNIQLNTDKVRKDLKDIKTDIDKLGRVNISTNQKAQRVEARIAKSKDAQRAAMVETRRIGDLVQKAADQGLKVDKARRAINKAALADGRQDFKTAKAHQKVALEELKIQRAITKEKAQQARLSGRSMAGGPFTSTGIASSRFGSVREPGSPRFIASRIGMVQGPQPASVDVKPSGPISSLTRLTANTPLGLSGVEAFPITRDLGTFGPKKPFIGQTTGFGRNPVGGRSDLVGSPANLLRIAKENAMPVKGFEFLAGSPAYYERVNKDILKIAKSKGNVLPVGGMKHLVGSPAYLEDQAKQLKKLRGAPTGFTAAQFGPQQPEQGPAFPTGAAQPLNIDSRGNLLPGPLGSRQTRAGLMRTLSRNRGPAFQSAAISGAFPLLFGQGPLAALGGGLGGGLGGAFGGQMGGFAGGLIGTAVVSSIQGFTNSIKDLGTALSPLTADVNAVVSALGVTGTTFGNQLQIYTKVASRTDALNEATKQMSRLIGDEGVAAITEFGESSVALKNDFDRAMLGMQAAVARVALFIGNRFNLFDKEGIRSLRSRARTTFRSGKDPEMNKIKSDVETVLRAPLDFEKGVTVRGQTFTGEAFKKDALDFLDQEKIKRQKNIDLQEAGLLTQKTVKQISKNRLDNLTEENRVLQDTLNGGEIKAEIEARIRALTKEVLGDQEKLTADQITQIENQRKIITNTVTNNHKLKETVDIAKQVADAFDKLKDTIAIDIGDGIKGLIRGTQTLNDVLRNVVDRLADAALNMAIFGNVGGGSVTGGLLGSIFKADGGPVKRGGSFIVGERGPELFTPGVSGMITPNHALGGSTNVVVNVDASGSSVEGDEQQGRELGRVISAAVQSEILNQKRPGGLLA